MSEGRIKLIKARLAFPCLDKPRPYKDSEPRFSATALFEPKSANHKLAHKAVKSVASDKWDEEAEAILKEINASNKCALRNGDVKASTPGYAGMWFINANAKAGAPPRLMDAQANELPRDTSMFYPGCYVNMIVEFWAMDKSKGFGNQINAQLCGVQFAGHGDSFAAGVPAAPDEFDVVEGVDELDDEDDDDLT